MIPVPRTADYGKNEKAAKGEGMPCAVCGRMVKQGKDGRYRFMVHVGAGGGQLVTDEEAAGDPAGDMGWFPVGPDCWRNNPAVHEYGLEGV